MHLAAATLGVLAVDIRRHRQRYYYRRCAGTRRIAIAHYAPAKSVDFLYKRSLSAVLAGCRGRFVGEADEFGALAEYHAIDRQRGSDANNKGNKHHVNVVQWHPNPYKAGIHQHTQYQRDYGSAVIDVAK